MAEQWLRDGLYPIRDPLVAFWLLVDADGAALIDSGFLGGVKRLGRKLDELGLEWGAIHSILITHGHLDHVYNAHRLKALTGAKLYAHRLDLPHIQQRWRYKGDARVCGWLESSGRRLFGWREPEIDIWIEDGDIIDAWGGLRVVHLPGHTVGHCGFHSRREKVLFSGDLFAQRGRWATVSPFYLNTAPGLFGDSLKKACALDASLVLPNHAYFADALQSRKALDALTKRFCASEEAEACQ